MMKLGSVENVIRSCSSARKSEITSGAGGVTGVGAYFCTKKIIIPNVTARIIIERMV